MQGLNPEIKEYYNLLKCKGEQVAIYVRKNIALKDNVIVTYKDAKICGILKDIDGFKSVVIADESNKTSLRVPFIKGGQVILQICTENPFKCVFLNKNYSLFKLSPAETDNGANLEWQRIFGETNKKIEQEEKVL